MISSRAHSYTSYDTVEGLQRVQQLYRLDELISERTFGLHVAGSFAEGRYRIVTLTLLEKNPRARRCERGW